MKNISFILGMLLLAMGACAQSISRKVLPAAGGTLAGGNYQINFTIGEPLNTTLIGGGNMITQGFQQAETAAPAILYVKQGAAGNGLSWATASGDLQAMINIADAGTTTQIWMAGGTYLPNRRADAIGTITPNDRNNAFVLKNNVQVYGGFAGTETLLSQRDLSLTANASTLSGDFSGNDVGLANNTENAYHVVISAGAVSNAALDGFTIRGGNANPVSPITVNEQVIQGQGGGLYLGASSPQLANINVAYNTGSSGGGMYINGNSTIVMSNSGFYNNEATGNGGAIYYTLGSVLTASACSIANNKALSGQGGAVYSNGRLIITNNTSINGNSAFAQGGGVYATRAVTLTNSSITNNNATHGAGIYSISGITVTNSSISNNTASVDGGGVLTFGTLSVSKSSINGNQAANVGGIFMSAGAALTMANSQVNNNTTSGQSGAIHLQSVASAVLTNCLYQQQQAARMLMALSQIFLTASLRLHLP